MVDGRPKIIIVGGGVAGLSAAQELKQRGFCVEIYERRPILGGKARSRTLSKADRVVPELVGLPSEHGFRFFPGFYRHLIDTMRRIPDGQGGRVIDRLVTVPNCAIAQFHEPFAVFPSKGPRSVRDSLGFLRQLLESPSLGLGADEAAFAAAKLVTAMTICDERRRSELDDVSWWDYMCADRMSEDYRRVIINGLTRNFVAMDAKLTSLRTAVTILARLLQDFIGGNGLDRILDGPTSEVWIDPWERELCRGGRVTINKGVDVIGFEFDVNSSRITGLRLPNGAQGNPEPDAMYVAAVPVEAMIKLLDNTDPALREHAPSLKHITSEYLKVNWMSGIQFYLQVDAPMCPGHIIYLDSSWAITSISQNQFWRRKVNSYGQNDVQGIVSAIISDWFAPGNGGVSHRTAQNADDAEEIETEARAQIERHLAEERGSNLSLPNVVSFFLDDDLIFNKIARRLLMGPMPAIEFVSKRVQFGQLHPDLFDVANNLEPLFINTVGSWQYRPSATTEVENLFLASDYVKNNTDLATMEGANESARRAVNGVLDLLGDHAPRCRIFPFDEPAIFAPAEALDRVLFKLGLPHPGLFSDAAGSRR
jgi:uncharacterized protein with NAD-binding domain and iron-sulfur cluster